MPALVVNSLPSKRINSKYIYSPVEGAFGSDKCRVDVEFADGLSIEQVTATISKLSNPQVIVWYIGCYGLKKAGVQFYKNFLISPVVKQNTEATFWLVDLTAWGAFKNSKCSIHSSNSCCESIEGFGDKKIKCIKSAAVFRKIEKIAEHDLIDYFKKALQRSFISRISKKFPNKNILVKEILSSNCQIASDWHNHDTNKSYSVFQYLEGCLLVEEIFMQEALNKGAADIQIVFALPNDEIKYYRDKGHSFQKDIAFLISKRCTTLNIKNIHLQIKFLAFKYGSQLHDRPYNAPGKTLKNGTLSYEDVVGYMKNEKNNSQEELIYASSTR